MRGKILLSAALFGLLALGAHSGARAVSVAPSPLSAAALPPHFHLARAVVRGSRGGGAIAGPRGAVVRGPRGRGAVVGRRGAIGRGPHGGAVIGRRYYGGVWYGTGRRYWRGRWWAYGVGSCWRTSPIGYVWICG
jgi:hypothetical protein